MISMYRIDSVTLLAGSVHFLPEGTELPDELAKAYENKGALVIEANSDECDNSLEELEEGTALQDLISDECLRRVLAAFEELGRAPEDAETLKPWACARWLQAAALERAGFSYKTGVDEQLRSRASGDGKPVHFLEPADTALKIFDAMPIEQQQKFINRTIDELDTIPEVMARMISAWRSGDDRAIERITEKMPLGRLLLNLRNQIWTQGISKGLSAAPDALVVVGIGHLVGPGNLVRMLRNNGIKASRI